MVTRVFGCVLAGLLFRSGSAGGGRPDRMEAYPEIKPLFRMLGNDIIVIYDELTSGR